MYAVKLRELSKKTEILDVNERTERFEKYTKF